MGTKACILVAKIVKILVNIVNMVSAGPFFQKSLIFIQLSGHSSALLINFFEAKKPLEFLKFSKSSKIKILFVQTFSENSAKGINSNIQSIACNPNKENTSDSIEWTDT